MTDKQNPGVNAVFEQMGEQVLATIRMHLATQLGTDEQVKSIVDEILTRKLYTNSGASQTWLEHAVREAVEWKVKLVIKELIDADKEAIRSTVKNALSSDAVQSAVESLVASRLARY